jgi:hypothetical protein
MLIDVTRRPIRLNFEECPTLIVVRTMGISGESNGILHQETRNRSTAYVATPSVKALRGSQEYLETVLPNPRAVKPQYKLTYNRVTYRQAEATDFVPQPLPDEPYCVVTGFQDHGTQKSGVWRLNFIFDPGPKEGLTLLTILDETLSSAR